MNNEIINNSKSFRVHFSFSFFNKSLQIQKNILKFLKNSFHLENIEQVKSKIKFII